MILFYNITVFFYHFLISIAGIFNKKARLFTNGRKDWYKKLKEKADPKIRYVWFHCSSLGEFEQGRPIMEAIKKRYSGIQIILTFFSPSGYEIRKNYHLADIVCYLPKDTKKNAVHFLNLIHPERVFFVKYEFWYHYINQCYKKNVPLYLISGIFRKEQVFFTKKPWGKWFRGLLMNFTGFFVQDENSASLLGSVGIKNCTISGDTRFDRVVEIAKSSQPLPIVEKFSEGAPLMIAGSTWKPDEEVIVPFIDQQPGMKFIIAPHEVSQGNINRLIRLLKKPVILLSQANEAEIGRYEVIIVDSVGKLSAIYRYGTFAYIGGGFGAGIHNILEATTFGLPVFFGPNYKKFREAVQLIDAGAAFTVNSAEEFRQAVLPLLENADIFGKITSVASGYVASNAGATEIILKGVF